MITAYVAAAVAFAVSLVATPLVRALARRFGLIARPTGDRWHKRPTALFGGVAIFLGFGVALIFLGPQVAVSAHVREALGILGAATLMFVTGLVDDRWKLKPATKLVAQGAAGAVLVTSGVVYPVTGWLTLDVLFTLFWFIAITNALNLLDNMDGVAAGVASIAAAFLALSFARVGHPILSAICLILVGAAAGFLPYNFSRASIFMGDSGSLFLGSLLAGLGAAYPGAASGSLVSVLFVPAFITIIPIVDTLLVSVMRTLAGRPISLGGRDHTAHRLVAMGLSEPQVAILLYAFAAGGGAIALVLRGVAPGIELWIGGTFLTALAIFASYLGQMQSYAPGSAPTGRVTVLVSNLLYKRHALEVLLDLVIFAGAYYGAFLLRFDGELAAHEARVFASTLGVAVAAMSVSFALTGVYRSLWAQVSLADVYRLARGIVLGVLAAAGTVLLVFRTNLPPRTIFVLFAMLSAGLAAISRISFRSLDLLRRSLADKGGDPAVIYGAGKGGELVCRELVANADRHLRAVAFVDDDSAKRGRLIHGVPVVGGSPDLRKVLAQTGARKIVLSTKKLTAERLRTVSELCSQLGIEVMVLSFDLAPITNSMNGSTRQGTQSTIR